MAFVKTTWNAGAAPGISAAQLNRIEAGIDDLYNGGIRKMRGGFRAYMTATTAALAAYAHIPFSVDDVAPGFDLDGWFDKATGVFTPQVAGYYLISAQLAFSTGGMGAGQWMAALRKNQLGTSGTGVMSWGTTGYWSGAGGTPTSFVQDLILFNGTTDFMDVVGWNNVGTSQVLGGQVNSWFTGFLVGF